MAIPPPLPSSTFSGSGFPVVATHNDPLLESSAMAGWPSTSPWRPFVMVLDGDSRSSSILSKSPKKPMLDQSGLSAGIFTHRLPISSAAFSLPCLAQKALSPLM